MQGVVVEDPKVIKEAAVGFFEPLFEGGHGPEWQLQAGGFQQEVAEVEGMLKRLGTLPVGMAVLLERDMLMGS